MLPFTKRPGRDDESAADSAVITKDDAVKSPGAGPLSKRSVPPSSSSSPRKPTRSAAEEDMTNIMQSRSMTGPVLPVPLPAAGHPAIPPASRSRPVTVRPPGPGSVRPPPSSMRPPPSSARNNSDEDAPDDDEGRTVVRGAPKIVRRTNPKQQQKEHASGPTSISPAAVIKATLESARANRREQLMPGPPSDLLEDSTDFPEGAPSARTPFIGRSHPPPSFEGPPSHRPPASYAPPSSHPHGYMGHHHGPPSAPVSSYPGAYQQSPNSVPGVAMAPSMPAHFMTPQAPYSDPPGTAVTSGSRVAGRPAVSWAAALLACGLFVGVTAVAVMQNSDSLAETTASFVDPSRAQAKAAAAAQPTALPVAPTAVAPPPAPTAPAAANPNANPSAPPPGLLGASPMPPAPPPEQPVGVAPVVTTPGPGIAFAPVPVSPKPAARPPVQWRPAPAPAPAPKAAAKAPAASDDDPPKKTAKKSGKAEPDDETKKALEALQKAQLESASSFGDK